MAKSGIFSTVGGRIRAVRRAHGEAQLDLAEHLGISRAAVSQWESDKTEPSTQMVSALVKHYDLKYEWLLYGKGRPPSLSSDLARIRRRLPAPQRPEPAKNSDETIVDFIVSTSRAVQNQEVKIILRIVRADGRRCVGGEASPQLARRLAEAIMAALQNLPIDVKNNPGPTSLFVKQSN